ncbi:MAG: DUF167 domain-containing protein [Rhodospirillales bacterium]|nr:DUF167 domain-containing protein [Rhodospirillales bacterium]MCW9040891.1 DUF167 domain-containing protein [Rhodospirillales bacterium]
MPDGPFRTVPEGVRVAIRVAPGASANRVMGLVDTADGGRALKVSVTAAPEGGKANAAVVKLLARAWKVPKSSITVVSGVVERNKTLLVTDYDDARSLRQRLNKWMENIADE